MKLVIAAVASTATLAACGGTEVVQPSVNVSIGQQLIDLKQAKDRGALSEKEYESQKRALIKSVE